MPARQSERRVIKGFTYNERVSRYEDQRCPSDVHHKILDYRIAEILISTLALAIITFFRLRH